MKDKNLASLKEVVSGRLLLLSFVVSVLYWIIESAIDTLFHDEAFTQRLWPDDPNELWMRFTVVALVLAFSGYAQFFINRQERTERSLQESEDRFRGLSEASFEGLAISEKGKIVEINHAFTEIFGYEPEEALGMEVGEFVTAESRELVRRNIATGSEEPYEVTGLRKDGTCFHAEARGKMSEYQGRRVRVAAIADVTKRKLAEQELRQSEERYRQVFEKNRAVKLLIDPESGAILNANVAACEYYGYSLEELKARSIADINILSPEQVAEEMSRVKERTARVLHLPTQARDWGDPGCRGTFQPHRDRRSNRTLLDSPRYHGAQADRATTARERGALPAGLPRYSRSDLGQQSPDGRAKMGWCVQSHARLRFRGGHGRHVVGGPHPS